MRTLNAARLVRHNRVRCTRPSGAHEGLALTEVDGWVCRRFSRRRSTRTLFRSTCSTGTWRLRSSASTCATTARTNLTNTSRRTTRSSCSTWIAGLQPDMRHPATLLRALQCAIGLIFVLLTPGPVPCWR
eukprot:1804365-Rhodomonas_salina.2